jgi:peptidyl-prolyl cis-trans isomerase B (cyclophilin B)
LATQKKKLSKAAEARIAGYQAKSTLVEGRKEARRKDNLLSIALVVGAVVVAISAQLVYFNFGPGVPKPTAKPTAKPLTAPSESVAENRVWTGNMTVAGKPIEFELYGDKAPKAVANFVTLARKNFFNSTGCHRLTTSGIYVLQCGDPAGDGTGGPGYNFGPVENAPKDNIYAGGVIAMARQSNAANSMGSQFFIVYGSSYIPADSAGGYTVIGKITKNQNSIRELAKLGTADGSKDGKPKNPIQLADVTVK